MALFRPKERAETLGAITGGSFRGGWEGCREGSWSSFDSVRGGSRGGKDGKTGKSGNEGGIDGMASFMLGVDFVAFNVARGLSLFSRFGGNGGREASPHAGAFKRHFASVEGDLDVVVVLVAFETPDRLDIVEFIDSVESRLGTGPEGRRGGRAGEGKVGWRFGRGGGTALGLSTVFWPVRTMTGGGKNPFWRAPLCSLPMEIFVTVPLTSAGGMFVVFCL